MHPSQPSSHRRKSEFCTKQSSWSFTTWYLTSWKSAPSVCPYHTCPVAFRSLSALEQLQGPHHQWHIRCLSGVWSGTTTVKATRRNSQHKICGMIRPRWQTSSTWITDERRRVAGLLQQQQQWLFGWLGGWSFWALHRFFMIDLSIDWLIDLSIDAAIEDCFGAINFKDGIEHIFSFWHCETNYKTATNT